MAKYGTAIVSFGVQEKRKLWVKEWLNEKLDYSSESHNFWENMETGRKSQIILTILAAIVSITQKQLTIPLVIR